MEKIKKVIENPSEEYRCDVRWWLAEGLHTDQTLTQEIRTLKEDGFGAAEFLAIDELDADSTRYGWGSEEWVHDTQLIIEETTKNGLGASLTSGTNWSNANLPDFVHVPDDPSAAKELDFAVEAVAAGVRRSGPLQLAEIANETVGKQELVAVVAARLLGEEAGKPLLAMQTLVLTDEVMEGSLDWTAPNDGDYLLFTFWLHGTGQTASPSVSVSYTVNYLDRYGIDKLIEYWDCEVLTPELRKVIRKNGRVQMYMDSLELSTHGKGGQLWGIHLCEEFRRRRSYDLTPYLPFMVKQSGFAFGPYNYLYAAQDTVLVGKVRNDLYQTMTDLYIENMLRPMREWLHREGMALRAEISYGLPFEISQPGKYVDGIETESLEFASQIDSYRGLAGVAHLYGKVYSSETGATMHNYMLGLDFYTQIIYTQFAAGVTKTVLHGYSSIRGSAETTEWPGHEGMWPIFSERFGSRQPAYQHYSDWTGMIARYQRLLRSGKPRRDVAILRLDYNFWNMVSMKSGFTNEKDLYENGLMRANEGIYWKNPALQNAGYSYDYFAPQLLEDSDIMFGNGELQPDQAGYRAVIVYQEGLPLSSARALLKHAQQGLPVIFINGTTETVQTDTNVLHEKAACKTPYNDGGDEDLATVVAQIKSLPKTREIDDGAQVVSALEELEVLPRAGFKTPNQNVLTLTRQDGDITYVFIYNYMYTRGKTSRFELKIQASGVPCRIDCWNGAVVSVGLYMQEDGATVVPLTLKPGEATMVAVVADKREKPYIVKSDAPIVRDTEAGWTIGLFESGHYTTHFSDGHTVETDVECRPDILLALWDLEVEDWNAGDKKVITEDRGLGYVTEEVYYETQKNLIRAGTVALAPWKDIPDIGPHVSGVGYYTTTFTLPGDWGPEDGAIFEVESVGGNSVAIYVNGIKGPAVDFERLEVDLTGFLRPGTNTLTVEVSSTLYNRLLQRGYYKKAKEQSCILMQTAMGKSADHGPDLMGHVNLETGPQSYGLQGDAWIRTYKVAVLNPYAAT